MRAHPIAAALAGTAWLVATFLPWRAHGLLASSTLLEAARYAHRGAVDVVPPGVSVLLLGPALAGVLLIGLAGFGGRWVARVRGAVALAGGLVVGALVVVLTRLHPERFGTGALVATAGLVVLVAGALVSFSEKSATRGRRSP